MVAAHPQHGPACTLQQRSALRAATDVLCKAQLVAIPLGVAAGGTVEPGVVWVGPHVADLQNPI